MLSIGQKFPEFNILSVVSLEKGNEFVKISSEEHKSEGKWMVMFWYPKDFTYVCPTEIIEFDKNLEEFEKRKTFLIGASTDTEYVHLAWRKNEPDLKELRIPLLADTSKSLAEELGILEENEKIAYRATFIIDPDGIIRWICVNDLNIGRNVPEVLRVLDALQTGKLCPCNWETGQDTL